MYRWATRVVNGIVVTALFFDMHEVPGRVPEHLHSESQPPEQEITFSFAGQTTSPVVRGLNLYSAMSGRTD